jgi:hypothetical protein
MFRDARRGPLTTSKNNTRTWVWTHPRVLLPPRFSLDRRIVIYKATSVIVKSITGDRIW